MHLDGIFFALSVIFLFAKKGEERKIKEASLQGENPPKTKTSLYMILMIIFILLGFGATLYDNFVEFGLVNNNKYSKHNDKYVKQLDEKYNTYVENANEYLKELDISTEIPAYEFEFVSKYNSNKNKMIYREKINNVPFLVYVENGKISDDTFGQRYACKLMGDYVAEVSENCTTYTYAYSDTYNIQPESPSAYASMYGEKFTVKLFTVGNINITALNNIFDRYSYLSKVSVYYVTEDQLVKIKKYISTHDTLYADFEDIIENKTADKEFERDSITKAVAQEQPKHTSGEKVTIEDNISCKVGKDIAAGTYTLVDFTGSLIASVIGNADESFATKYEIKLGWEHDPETDLNVGDTVELFDDEVIYVSGGNLSLQGE